VLAPPTRVAHSGIRLLKTEYARWASERGEWTVHDAREVGLVRDGRAGHRRAKMRVPRRRSGRGEARWLGEGGHEIETEAGELWARCRAGDATARHALIERYLPLCRRIAFATKVLPTAARGAEDLEAAGVIGLIQAVDRFDPSRGIPFEGYAALRVRGAVLDEVRRLDDLSRGARLRAREDEHRGAVSLDVLQERGEMGEPAEIAEVDARAAHDGLRDDVERALAAIPVRERAILASYYSDGLTLATIGRRLGISEARVSQLHSRAIAQLRSLLGVVAVKVDTARAAA
jgi:RNA polymerase sigma factor FliA